MGEVKTDALKVKFDGELRPEFHGATVTSDAGLLAYRELDDAFGLTAAGGGLLADVRTGMNTQHTMTALLPGRGGGSPGTLRGHSGADRTAAGSTCVTVAKRGGAKRSLSGGQSAPPLPDCAISAEPGAEDAAQGGVRGPRHRGNPCLEDSHGDNWRHRRPEVGHDRVIWETSVHKAGSWPVDRAADAAYDEPARKPRPNETKVSTMRLRVTLLAVVALSSTAPLSWAAEAVTVYPAPKGAPLSKAYAVTVGGKQVDVYACRRDIGSFTTCDINGKVTVAITPAAPVKKLSVHPSSLGIKAAQNGKNWTFEVEAPCNLAVLVDDSFKDQLFLFLNPPLEPPPKDAVVFGPGMHLIEGTKNDHVLRMKSGQTLYLAGGAWVEGGVLGIDAENVRIMGRGVLSQSERVNVGAICFRRCKNVSIDGIVETRNLPGWCTTLQLCQDVAVSNYHVVAGAGPSTDGCNPCNSQNVTITKSFFRTHDDCIAIKGNSGGTVREKLPINPSTQPPCENIDVRQCVFWSTYNNVICIGAETRAKHFKNIRFEDCDILYHAKYHRLFGAISILPLHGTFISDISFENIRVECNAGKLFCFKFGEMLYGSGIPGDLSYPGGISNVTIRNISVARQSGPIESEFRGFNEKTCIKNVTIENLSYGGKCVTNVKEMGLSTAHVEGIKFLPPVPEKTPTAPPEGKEPTR